jgi:hypothetical protein
MGPSMYSSVKIRAERSPGLIVSLDSLGLYLFGNTGRGRGPRGHEDPGHNTTVLLACST